MKFMGIQKNFKTTQAELIEVNRKVTSLGDIYADKGLVEELQKRQDVFESIETMDIITNVFFPRMQKFIEQVEAYDKDHEMMREVLVRYDETLSHKATRFEMR